MTSAPATEKCAVCGGPLPEDAHTDFVHALIAERTRELAEARTVLSWVVVTEGSKHICPDNPEVCYVAAARRALSNGEKP